MIIEKIQFTHTAYVEWLKRKTCNNAESMGWLLNSHCKLQNVAAFSTMTELGFEKFSDDCWQQAGELILANEKIEV